MLHLGGYAGKPRSHWAFFGVVLLSPMLGIKLGLGP